MIGARTTRTLVASVGAALLLAACAAPGGGGAGASVAPALTIERLLDPSDLVGSSPSSPAWAPDSSLLAFRWAGEAGGGREVWVVGADGSDLRPLTEAPEGSGSVSSFVWLPDTSGLLYLRSGSLWRTDRSGWSTLVSDELGGAWSLDVSPEGEHASFLRDGDLWLCTLATGELRRLTDVAVPSIASVGIGRYVRPDVEIGPYIWGGPTYAWSPDGRTIAVHHVDRRGLPPVPFPDYLAEETEPNLVRRGYPGDPNEARSVGLLDVETADLTLLALPEPTENRIVDFSWSSDGRLLIDRDSDTAVDRWLHVLDPTTGELREIWSDRRETRVYTSAGSAWAADGSAALVLADLDDRYGLYRVDARAGTGGALPDPLHRLSDPGFDVTSPPKVAAGSGSVFFESNEPSPYETHVFRADPAGRAPTRVTRLAGQNRAYPSPDGTVVALMHSDDGTPSDLYLVDGLGREPEQRITRSTPEAFDEHPWARVRYATFPSKADGAELHARILEPVDLDRSKRHPVVFGPMYSNTVRNRWSGRFGLVQQLLVERGFIVVQVDVRGSTGYGRQFREEFLNDFAGRDLEDVESAVRHMQSLPYVAPDRFGIWGSSYGGTLTVYALLKKPGLFRAGVAGAAAVDPYFFGSDDVAIVRRPESHPEAFTRGAAQYAANLEDHLLIIHGMQDQIVPFKTTVALAEALMRQGKDFDFAFAPAATHSWTSRAHYARYLLGKLVAHFERHLSE